ncbi:MAG: SDR family NAD(P)-dependent oxidoreductase, partial [Streptomyces sp.]|nr:SDR family NAD(P)-dependent oxidoreductase [Streptomyces sp.]
RGAMASLAVGAEEAEKAIGGRDGVVVAAVNGPGSTVISGPPEAVAEVVAGVEASGGRARLIDVDYASHGPQVDEIAEDLVTLLGEITPVDTTVGFYSTVTGHRVETSTLDATYWVENLRRQVRFATAIEAVLAEGYRVLVEAGPHPVLSVGIQETAQAGEVAVATVPTLQRDQGGPAQLARALAHAFAAGLPVDWRAWYGVDTTADTQAPAVLDLPTYPFQRRHYWIDPATLGGSGDAQSLGLASADHPLLGAAVRVAESGEAVLTGLISTAGHSWLADHAVAGAVFLPGTAFVDLAVRAGDEVGCDRVEELVLEAPLILPEEGALQLQLVVSAPGQDGSRAFTVHARAHGDSGGAADRPWTRHASGTLTTGARPDDFDFTQWPPADAEPLSLDGLYTGLAEAGYGYGPAFRGLKAAWRRGDEVFAEAALPEELREEAGRFGLHPALLDAALQAGGIGQGGTPDGQMLLPFTWSGVSLYATGAAALRVRMVPNATADGVSLSVADPSGRQVASAEAVVSRPVSLEQLRRSDDAGLDSLYRVEWISAEPKPGVLAESAWEVLGDDGLGIADALERAGHSVRTAPDLAEVARAVDDGTPPAELVVLPCAPLAGAVTEADPGLAAAVHDETARLLGVVQHWLADERFADSRLAVVTRGAQSTGGDEGVTDLVHSALWGLVRSAQLENIDRLLLVDLEAADLEATDESDPTDLLPSALAVALGSGEPQVAVRHGGVVVPRLTRIGQDTEPTPPDLPDLPGHALDTEGTVLITGGTGTIGGVLARHLITTHGVRHLLLTSRRGGDAPGAAALRDELAALGAEVTVAACDAADRDALAALLAGIPAEHPLTGVVHAAGVTDDGTIPSLTAEQLHKVLRPKVDAAVNLHQLTRAADLATFVLFSSTGGVAGVAGQGNYAASNAFLDALAQDRRAAGLPGQALSWGHWEQSSGITGALAERDIARMERSGIRAMSSDQGLALFDAAVRRPESLLVPVRLDAAALRDLAGANVLPRILSGLVRGAPVRRTAAGHPIHGDAWDASSMAERLAGLSAVEQSRTLLELVRRNVAAVLGIGDVLGVDPARPFKEIGFDSLTAVELRNRLSQATDIKLPSTLIFDIPTPALLAEHLRDQLVSEGLSGSEALIQELDRLEDHVDLLADAEERDAVTARLEALLARCRQQPAAAEGNGVAERLQAASADEVLQFIDSQLGRA